MKTMKVPITASIKDKQCDILTAEALNKNKNKKNLPILDDFYPNKVVGHVKNIEYSFGMLVAEIELSKKVRSWKNKIFRIQGIIKKGRKIGGGKDSKNIIEDFDLTGIGMIDKAKDVYPLNLELGMKIT